MRIKPTLAAVLLCLVTAAHAADKPVEKPATTKPAAKPVAAEPKAPVKTYENYADILAAMPDALPGDQGWDKYSIDKANTWLKVATGSKIKVSAITRSITIAKNHDAKGPDSEWRITVAFAAQLPFDFRATEITPHINGNFSVAASEAAARQAEQLPKGAEITVEGTITAAKVAMVKDKKANLSIALTTYTLTGLPTAK